MITNSIQENQRERFLDNAIPFDDIDIEMRDLIDVLNFKAGLKTQFCCYGHNDRANQKTYVIFDSSVEDYQIYNLASYLEKKLLNFGSFNKWVRGKMEGSGDLMVNWKYESGVRFEDQDSPYKKQMIDNFTKTIIEYCKQK